MAGGVDDWDGWDGGMPALLITGRRLLTSDLCGFVALYEIFLLCGYAALE
jgi:hypothetical protein